MASEGNPCKECGRWIPPTGQRGAPAKTCAACKAKADAKVTVPHNGDNATATVAVDPQPEAKPDAKPPVGSIDRIIHDVVENTVQGQIDDLKRDLANVKGGGVQRHEIVLPDHQTVTIKGTLHKLFPLLLKVLMLQHTGLVRAPYLYGPSGSGKTYLAKQLGEALGVPVFIMAVHSQMDNVDVRGFRDANGNPHHEAVYYAMKHGGLLLLDELDKGNPSFNASMNSLVPVDCKKFTFAGEEIDRSDKFMILGSGNNTMLGSEDGFVSEKQDIAFRDRFDFHHVDYDLAIEDAMVAETPCEETLAAKWLSIVRQIRANAPADVAVTPRSAQSGATYLSLGMTIPEVLESTLLAGRSANTRRKLMADVSI
jgi:hypothetical protein